MVRGMMKARLFFVTPVGLVTVYYRQSSSYPTKQKEESKHRAQCWTKFWHDPTNFSEPHLFSPGGYSTLTHYTLYITHYTFFNPGMPALPVARFCFFSAFWLLGFSAVQLCSIAVS